MLISKHDKEITRKRNYSLISEEHKCKNSKQTVSSEI